MAARASPDLLCGLLCRFLGARFVAASRSRFVCQIGAHAMAKAVTVHISMRGGDVLMQVVIVPDTGGNVCTSYSCRYPRAADRGPGGDSDVVFTARVARWVVPILMRTTFVQIPHSGARGCAAVASHTLAAAAFAYAGGGDKFEYDSRAHRATSGSVALLFWARHVSLVCPAGEFVVAVPISTMACDAGEYMQYTEADESGHNGVDELVVQTCQMTLLCRSRCPTRAVTAATGTEW